MVDLTADEEEIDDAPATPPPNVSTDAGGEEIEIDEEDDILAYHGLNCCGADSSDEDGFQHV